MSDYISREALKEAFDNADADVCESSPDGHCDWGFGRKNISDVMDGVPAADVEPVRRWIPCSERLPEPETEVLTVCKRGEISFVVPAMYEDGKMLRDDSIWNWNEIEGYGLYSEDADDWFIPEGWWEYRQFNDDDVYNNLIDCAVTHWQPLPEPPEKGGAWNG